MIALFVFLTMIRDPQTLDLCPDGDRTTDTQCTAAIEVESFSLGTALRTRQLWFICLAELFGTRSHGALIGLIWFCGTLGGSTGPWLTGYLFDTTGSYQVAFLILMAFGLLGLVLIGVLRPLHRGVQHPG